MQAARPLIGFVQIGIEFGDANAQVANHLDLVLPVRRRQLVGQPERAQQRQLRRALRIDL